MGADGGRCGSGDAAVALESRAMDLGGGSGAADRNRGGYALHSAGAERVRAAALLRAAAGARTVRCRPEPPCVTPVISPDGRTLAFLATVEEQRRIWIRPWTPIHRASLRAPRGSRSRPSGRPTAGRSHFLPNRSSSGSPSPAVRREPSATYGRVRARAPGVQRAIIVFGFGRDLYRVSADGGAISEIRKPDRSQDEDGLVFPEFLPDGDRFFYLAGVKNRKATVSTSGRSVRRGARS